MGQLGVLLRGCRVQYLAKWQQPKCKAQLRRNCSNRWMELLVETIIQKSLEVQEQVRLELEVVLEVNKDRPQSLQKRKFENLHSVK